MLGNQNSLDRAMLRFCMILEWGNYGTSKICKKPQIKYKYKIKLNSREISGSLTSIIKCWILSSGIPKFNVLYLEKYSDQTSWYLVMFDVKESPINKYLKANHLVKNFVLEVVHTNQAYCSLVLG